MDFEQLAVFRLDHGAHSSPELGLCAMEAVAWLDGQQHSDKPATVCRVLRKVVLNMNDSFSPDARQRLIPYLPRLLNTEDEDSYRLRFELIIRRYSDPQNLPFTDEVAMFKLLDELLAIGKQGCFNSDPTRRVDDYKSMVARQQQRERQADLVAAGYLPAVVKHQLQTLKAFNSYASALTH